MDARTYREQTQYDGYGRAGKTHDARGNMTSADSLRFYEYNALNQATEVRRVASVGSSDITIRARFAYGVDGARYRRIDDGSSAGGTTTTTIIGAVERLQKPGGAIQWRRMIGSTAIVSYSGDQLVGGITQAAGAGTVRHQFSDRLGSVQVIGSISGSSVTVHERLDPGTDGQWRTPDPPFGQAGSSHTPRGFTGHEHLEGHDTIHMNGRLYWPTGGRMVQADPIITDIYNPQNWNPYSYVLNNPLNLTDPSGYSFFDSLLNPFKNAIRSVMRALGPEVSGALIGACSFVPGAWSIACAAGASYDHARAFGASSSDARRSGVAGAFSAAVATIVKYRGSGLSTTSRVLIAATSGGVASVIQGGKFGHGFVSAGVTAGAAPYVSSNIVAGTATSAIIGGTVSEMTGGKFANGARSGAFAYVVMIGAHKIKSAVYEKSSIPAQHLYGSKDPYVDISHYDKVATALDVVFMTCADCDVPKLFSIEDMGDKATAATNVFTRHVTFNSRMLDFSEPSAAQLFLGTAYHETMHRANGFFRRFGDGFIDGVDNIANRGWTTGNHEMIYTRSAILAQQYISLYLRRLDSTRLVDQ